jgi:subtilisin family serine protease
MIQNTVLSIAGIDSVRRVSLGDPEICIAIIDSRVDLSHPVFAGAQLRELMPAWLTSRMGPAGASHGTHVASIIFGQPGGPLEGIAPRCRGVVIPVYGETENGELTPCSQEDLGRAISLALEAGARLINISGGELIDPGDEDPLLAKIVRSCEQQGVVIVAATGNEGCECLHAPATFETVLAVGAANASGRPMPFSNWDVSLADHGILAPGEGILGAVPGGGLAVQNGTSFACPIVTGAASLLLGLQKLRGEKPSPRAVRDALVATAIPCAPEDKEAECERMLGGRLNVVGATAPSSKRVRPCRRGLRRPPPSLPRPSGHRLRRWRWLLGPRATGTIVLHRA